MIFDNLYKLRTATNRDAISAQRSTEYVVLKDTTMSAVIIESGFISNAVDRAYLTSTTGQNQIAYGIYTAFRRFCWGV